MPVGYTPSRITRPITSPDLAAKFFRRQINRRQICESEQFHAMFVNDKKKVIGYIHLHTGTRDYCPIDFRLLFKSVLMSGCTGFFIAHNHTNNKLEPSDEDIEATRRIRKLAREFEIELLDHIIITETTYFSFGEWLELD